MKSIYTTITPETDYVDLVLFYDLHIGSKKCDFDSIKERIDYVKDTKGAYAILGGDLINNSTKTSVGDVYSEPLSPMQQIQVAVSLFQPIKDKIIAITSGNHERRSYKTDGIDLTYFFATELGIADVYDYTGCLNFISIEGRGVCKNPLMYTVYTVHGDGNGGRTIGGKANGLERRADIVDADIVIAGHTHQPFVTSRASYRINQRKKTIQQFTQLLVNAASSLNYEEYAELYGLRPSSKLMPHILLNTFIKEAHALL